MAARYHVACGGALVVAVLFSPAIDFKLVSGAENPDWQLANHAASILGVRPLQAAPRPIKRIAWRMEKFFVHFVSWWDAPDSKLSHRVLWWKALCGNNRQSPVCDDGLAYDMLPSFVRFPVHRLFCSLYPRWTHAIIEIRTAYLDRAVSAMVASFKARDPSKKIRLITMGGGYDVRSIKLRDILDEAVELDLPLVVEAKKRIFQRLQRRRRTVCQSPTLYAVDLQQLDEVKTLLQTILLGGGEGIDPSLWHTIFLFEGVLMYLGDGVPLALLNVCRQAVGNHSASLCFADEVIKESDDRDAAELALSKAGWNLVDWLVKGGRTRHMGIAESASYLQSAAL